MVDERKDRPENAERDKAQKEEYTDRQGNQHRQVEDRDPDTEIPVVGGDPSSAPDFDQKRKMVSPDPKKVWEAELKRIERDKKSTGDDPDREMRDRG
jgi:hypothetical protein